MNVPFDIVIIILSGNPEIINDSEQLIAEIDNVHACTQENLVM